MSLFTIGDPHLSFGSAKPMDIFDGWANYTQLLESNWRANVAVDDTVVLPGDISWAMSLEEALADFTFLHQLPGQKWLLKGNHDYWWTTMSKMRSFLDENGLTTIHLLHNTAVCCEGKVLCGTRGWMFDKTEPHNQKIVSREVGRLQMSLDAAVKLKADRQDEIIAFLHYPPIYGFEEIPELITLLQQYGVKRCYYGHIHGPGNRMAFNGAYLGVEFQLVACDYLRFNPFKIT